MATVDLGTVLKKKKISKRRFAKMLGISYHNVFRLFRAGQDPKLSTLNRWAALLGVRVRDILKE